MRKTIDHDTMNLFPENSDEIDLILDAWRPTAGIEAEFKKQIRKDPAYRVRIIVDRIE
jgi:hypothetical protein